MKKRTKITNYLYGKILTKKMAGCIILKFSKQINLKRRRIL